MERIRTLSTNENIDPATPDPAASQEFPWDEGDELDTPNLDPAEEMLAQEMGTVATRAALDVDLPPKQRHRKRESSHTDDEASAADPVRIYLNQIGKIPLLNAEQEVELSKTIEAGMYASHLLSQAEQYGAKLSPEMSAHLRVIARAGERAKDQMINSNLRLVVSVAKRPKYKSSGMSLLDLAQEGNIGLIRAVEKFDYSKGYKFSTYAMWWIQQSIERGIGDKANTIRVPVHQQDILSSARRVSNQLEDMLGREPTAEEVLAAKRDEAIKALRRDKGREPTPKEIFTRTNLTLDQIHWARKYKNDRLASLDAEIGSGDSGSTLQDVLADSADVSMDDEMLARERHDLAYALLDTLRATEKDGKRMADILMSRMKDETLDSIGRRYRISRERVRQLEKTATERMGRLAERLYADYFEQ